MNEENRYNTIEACNFDLPDGMILSAEPEGLTLIYEDQKLRGDFTKMLPRLKQNNLPKELLVKTAKIKTADRDADAPLIAIDATAGLGEDSLLLAASGFHVKLYERNPVIHQLLQDTLRRAADIPELAGIVQRMELHHEDSIEAMKHLKHSPDVILLDPMFPERQKSALVKKKLQMIQKLEIPCADEKELLRTAMEAAPKKLIIKRPPKGPYLADMKPDYSTSGKSVRFDCIVDPQNKLHKLK